LAFEGYDSKAVPTAETGTRISKVLYKAAGEGKEASGTNSFLRAPVVTAEQVTEHLVVLTPHIVEYLHTVQDTLVKTAHKDGRDSLETSELDIAAIITKLESTGQGRLNKEAIFNWYDAEVADSLIVAFADKFGISDQPTEEEAAKLEVLNSNYRVKFGALAGGKSTFVPEQAEAMQKALETTGAIETVLGARFNTRLEGMKTPVNVLESL
ncbi:MAG: hypothetical protein GY942_10940, partial [Aestuariibacter sp.]|nr:hypothetical protein [Aestuariibacter sp.]